MKVEQGVGKGAEIYKAGILSNQEDIDLTNAACTSQCALARDYLTEYAQKLHFQQKNNSLAMQSSPRNLSVNKQRKVIKQ